MHSVGGIWEPSFPVQSDPINPPFDTYQMTRTHVYLRLHRRRRQRSWSTVAEAIAADVDTPPAITTSAHVP